MWWCMSTLFLPVKLLWCKILWFFKGHFNLLLQIFFSSGHNPDDELIIKDAGGLSSPDFPKNYPNNVLQKYYMKAKKGDKVIFVFSYFRLEKNYDFVWIYDGYNHSRALIAQLTGIIDGPHIVSSRGNEVLFVFFSDMIISNKGFKVMYRQVELNKASKLSLTPNLHFVRYTKEMAKS